MSQDCSTWFQVLDEGGSLACLVRDMEVAKRTLRTSYVRGEVLSHTGTLLYTWKARAGLLGKVNECLDS